MRHLFRVENIDRWCSNWPLGAKMCFFDRKIWIFGAKSQFFVYRSRFLLMEQMATIPGATTFPSEPPPKNFRFRARGHFLGLTPVFGHSHFRGATTLSFGPISTKLGGTVRAIKKMTQKDNGPGPELRRNGRFYIQPKSGFWPKNG